MTLEEQQAFKQLADKCGSPYAACNAISKKARQYAEKNNNIVMHSEAISWVLSGETPKILNDYSKARRKHRSSVCVSITQEVLDLVNDTAVRHAVETSIRNSRREKHLIYMYEGICDEYKQSRVRVLCNIIWDKLQNM